MAIVFIIGGKGNQSSADNTFGGAYSDATMDWDTAQGPNGAAVRGGGSDLVISQDGTSVKITGSFTGGESSAFADMYAMVTFSGASYTTGHYKVTVSSAFAIILDLAYGAGPGGDTATVVVGGALSNDDEAFQIAADLVVAGDHIKVAVDNTGVATYDFNASVDIDQAAGAGAGSATARVTLEGVDNAGVQLLRGVTRPIITSTATSLVGGLFKVTGASATHYYDVSCIDFNGGGAGKADYGIYWDAGGSDYWRITNCDFHNCDKSGLYSWSDRGTIVECEFYGNGLDGGNDAGLYVPGYNNTLIACSAYNNVTGTSNGFHFNSHNSVLSCKSYGNAGDGFYWNAGDERDIQNNTAHNNGGSGFHFSTTCDRNTVYNNTSSDNTLHGWDFDSVSYNMNYFGYNNSWGNDGQLCDETDVVATWQALGQGNNISLNPLFPNGAAGDLRIRNRDVLTGGLPVGDREGLMGAIMPELGGPIERRQRYSVYRYGYRY